jgi:hypothetical protein
MYTTVSGPTTPLHGSKEDEEGAEGSRVSPVEDSEGGRGGREGGTGSVSVARRSSRCSLQYVMSEPIT